MALFFLLENCLASTHLLFSEGETCPYEYVMVESKKNITSRKIDKELEVCGRRHVGARWFEGSIRLTYASGGVMQKRGLITKFTGKKYIYILNSLVKQ